MAQRILVVEDEPDVLKFLMFRLGQKNYELVTARDGQEVLDLIAKERFDLILLDIKLPKMDGYEVCRRLKSDSATAGIPILFITADSTVMEFARDKKLCAEDFLLKPYDPSELYAKIDELLCGHLRPQ